jgi:hypothetical protein
MGNIASAKNPANGNLDNADPENATWAIAGINPVSGNPIGKPCE